MSQETVWLAPNVADLDSIMDQLVLNAGEKSLTELGNSQVTRAQANLDFHVSRIIAAIQTAARFPVSQDETTVPPEAVLHAMVLTVNSMTASKPNLGTVVVTLNGGTFSPFNDLVKRAEQFIADCQKGKPVTAPSWPLVRGGGRNLVIRGSSYNAAGTITVTGLQIGLQYSVTLGQNETGLTCGNVSLSASGSFYAPATSCVLSGVASALVTAAVQRSQLAVNFTRAGNVRGQVDMGTDGPGQSGEAYNQDWIESEIGTL